MAMNDNPYTNDISRSGPAGMSGFVLGALVGAGVALLFAPAAGTDTRRRLGETARKLGSAARDKFQEGREQTRSVIEGAREGARQGLEGARQGFESGRQQDPNRTGGEGQFAQARREPVPSTGTNPATAGSRPGTTPGRP
jgi:hypothetical protein